MGQPAGGVARPHDKVIMSDRFIGSMLRLGASRSDDATPGPKSARCPLSAMTVTMGS